MSVHLLFARVRGTELCMSRDQLLNHCACIHIIYNCSADHVVKISTDDRAMYYTLPWHLGVLPFHLPAVTYPEGACTQNLVMSPIRTKPWSQE